VSAHSTHDREAEWDALRAKYLRERPERAASTARGVHHVALVSSDVEQTIRAPRSLEEIGFPPGRRRETAEAVARHAGADIAEIDALLVAALNPPGKEQR
jgi:hypothetical protein